jgi:Sulfatase-modifying factor enzyme 1
MSSPSRTFAGFALATLGALVLTPWGCSSAGNAPPPIGYVMGDAATTEPDSTTSTHPDSSTDSSAQDATPTDSAGDSAPIDSSTNDAPETGPAGGCHDGVMDGNETDVDCGGSSCPACPEGDLCATGNDCTTDSCGAIMTDAGTEHRCFPATCMDHIKNGNETDVDCGGGTCPACLVGKECLVTSDCVSDICAQASSGAPDTCACPAAMVVVPTSLTLGGSYCIDALEVTKAAYYAFYMSNEQMTLPAQCGTDPDYTPHGDWPPALTAVNYNGGEPVHYVDWCDAYAYCNKYNKHLCGAIGGGEQDPTMPNAFLTDAWYNACSAKGNNTFPYSGAYEPTACNGYDLNSGAGIIAEVDINGTVQELSCQGGQSGLYYMSGNVAEWEDACDTSATPNCLVRGGSYASGAPVDGGVDTSSQLACTAATLTPFNTYDATIGFRCCQ